MRVYLERWCISYVEGAEKCCVAEADHCIAAEVGRIVLFLDMEYVLLNGDGN